MNKLVSIASLPLLLCLGCEAKAECFQPKPPGWGTPDCVSLQGYLDADGMGQVVGADTPLPMTFSAPSGGLPVTISGSVPVTQGGPFSVGASGLFPVTQGGPFSVSQSGIFSVTPNGVFSVTPSGAFPVTASGTFPVTQSGTFTITPQSTTTTSASGIVTVANSWQQILSANASRKGCLITNTTSGSIVVLVSFSASGIAVSGASVPLLQYDSVACAVGGMNVATDAVSVTASISGATFSVLSQ